MGPPASSSSSRTLSPPHLDSHHSPTTLAAFGLSLSLDILTNDQSFAGHHPSLLDSHSQPHQSSFGCVSKNENIICFYRNPNFIVHSSVRVYLHLCLLLDEHFRWHPPVDSIRNISVLRHHRTITNNISISLQRTSINCSRNAPFPSHRAYCCVVLHHRCARRRDPLPQR